jgi:DNA-binding MarR family transcriptional regulator
MLTGEISHTLDQFKFFEELIGLSVDLHNLNLNIQKKYGISLVQWLVLSKVVARPGLSAGTLSEIVGVQPSTLTPTLSRLEAMGLLWIQERPTDLRRKMILASQLGFEKNWFCHGHLSILAKGITCGHSIGPDINAVRILTRNFLSTLRYEYVDDSITLPETNSL